jgi:hypothetical protein
MITISARLRPYSAEFMPIAAAMQHHLLFVAALDSSSEVYTKTARSNARCSEPVGLVHVHAP